jgi:hypothetical protein
MRLAGTEGNADELNHIGSRLDKERNRILAKVVTILAELKTYFAFTVFEPSLGGAFPKDRYDAIIEEVQKYVSRTIATIFGAFHRFLHC